MNTKVIYSGPHGVEVIENVGQEDPSGKWEVRINRVAVRWYAIESVAVSCAKRIVAHWDR